MAISKRRQRNRNAFVNAGWQERIETQSHNPRKESQILFDLPSFFFAVNETLACRRRIHSTCLIASTNRP